jgi:hypothetical protein
MTQLRSAWRRTAAALVLLVLIPLACHYVPVEKAAPSVTPVSGSSLSAKQLDAGRAIYVSESKCASCHRPKPVFQYSADKWAADILPRMGKKCNLMADEYDSVLAYVTTASHARPATKNQ